MYLPQLVLSIWVDSLPAYEFTGTLWPILCAVPFALAFAVVLVPLAYVVGGRAGRFFVTIYALMYVPVLGWQLARYVNIKYDHAAPRIAIVQYVATHKGEPSMTEYTDWDDPSRTIKLVTGLRSADRVPGAPVKVTIHPGALGMEWVEIKAGM